MLGTGAPDSPVAAAAVVLVRDGVAGVEVLLIERNRLSDVLGGAFTFPGGKVDGADLEEAAALQAWCQQCHRALGEPALVPEQAVAIHLAALRELREEAGIGGLQVPDLLPWARWITPVASRRMPRHFDARFFVAGLPAGEDAVHDAREAVSCAWLAPADALRAFEAGRIQLAPPQVMSFFELASCRTAAEVLAAARGRAPVRIQPVVTREEGQDVICFPGDPHHDEPVRRLSGPPRMVWRDDRYRFVEPLEALLRTVT